jgi:hypothetical protein
MNSMLSCHGASNYIRVPDHLPEGYARKLGAVALALDSSARPFQSSVSTIGLRDIFTFCLVLVICKTSYTLSLSSVSYLCPVTVVRMKGFKTLDSSQILTWCTFSSTLSGFGTNSRQLALVDNMHVILLSSQSLVP